MTDTERAPIADETPSPLMAALLAQVAAQPRLKLWCIGCGAAAVALTACPACGSMDGYGTTRGLFVMADRPPHVGDVWAGEDNAGNVICLYVTKTTPPDSCFPEWRIALGDGDREPAHLGWWHGQGWTEYARRAKPYAAPPGCLGCMSDDIGDPPPLGEDDPDRVETWPPVACETWTARDYDGLPECGDKASS